MAKPRSGAKDGSPHVRLRARPGQIAFWKEAAELEGKNLSAWLKELATQRATEVFKQFDEKHATPVASRPAIGSGRVSVG